ncbi:DnaJ domain-containing protein [Colletotrichum musicola]|uniref:DnaJ domain-containing protein n=1 Tax=Colletotrichum musicola TaxID=2175873 RepID=A0A8H6N064_9PEZI|nr:DnaJ domain-containing protein [Colletotrichum musicola]
MASAAVVAHALPALLGGWSAEKDFKVVGQVSTATQRSLEPVGPHFLAHARRARHKRTFSEDDRIQAQEAATKVENDEDSDISEPEDPMMLQRDAKDWKVSRPHNVANQDHYEVLGITKYRWKATEDQIKRAHRKKVLKHHPDKKAAAGAVDDDNFFKCIQKASEVLLDPTKRRQYDSVDEKADVDPPTKKQLAKGNFYKLWGNVFKSEGRFSNIQPVPAFGDDKSTKDEVEEFYNFWYNFDSWRTFEYLDEDVPDDNENRDQKRHTERKNANARKKKKAEDNARLRKLLDDCSAGDERIKRFRQEANAAKNKKRLEKEAAEKKAIEDARLKKEAEEKAAKEAEEKAKADREAAKKSKEAAKNAVKKNKRVLKGSVKDANYFASGDASAATIDAVLGDVELVQGKIDADEIAALAGKLGGLKLADEIKSVWSEEVKRLIGAGKLKEGDAKSLIQ